MPSAPIIILFILACIVTNRLRGGGAGLGTFGQVIDNLPGRPLWYATYLMLWWALLLSNDWAFAVIVGAGYLVWGLLPWGKMFDLGAMPEEKGRKGEPFSDAVLRWLPASPATDALAMYVRELYILPFVIGALAYYGMFDGRVIALYTLWYALTAVVVRGIAFHFLHVAPLYRNFIAELAVGGVWGVLIVLIYAKHLQISP